MSPINKSFADSVELRIGQPSFLCCLQLCLYQKFEILSLSLSPFSLTPWPASASVLRRRHKAQHRHSNLKGIIAIFLFFFVNFIFHEFCRNIFLITTFDALICIVSWDSFALLLLQCDQCLYTQLGLAVNFLNFHYVKLQSIFVLEHCYQVKTEIISKKSNFFSLWEREREREREIFGSAQ